MAQFGLPGDQILFTGLELLSQPIQLLALSVVEIRLALPQLGLPGYELLLAGLDRGEASVQLHDVGARRRELPLELVGLRSDALVPVVDLRLAAPERGVFGGCSCTLLGHTLLAIR